MKTIGLIGGMSWESTAEYYRIMNETVKKRLGGLHSVKCLLYSFDFAEIEHLLEINDWSELSVMMIDAVRKLENAGAECFVICTNTIHKIAEDIENSVNIPLIHIADATGDKVIEKGFRTAGLLGSRFVMEEDFYKRRLKDRCSIESVIPEENDRNSVHDIIFSELCRGAVRQESRDVLLRIISDLASNGAEGIILGCTELSMIIKNDDTDLVLFDTTAIHALAAVKFALE